MRRLPEVPGIISARQVADTVDAIASVQQPDGNIPWTPGGHTDAWNLVEAAMALDIGGRHEEVRAAHHWLARMQRADGSWHAYYVGDEIEDPTLEEWEEWDEDDRTEWQRYTGLDEPSPADPGRQVGSEATDLNAICP